MKKEFSSKWKSSKQPRKQRKFIAKAPIHIRKKFLSVNLVKDLRVKFKKRNVPVRKGDMVKVMRGKFKKKQGKVIKVTIKKEQVFVDGIQVKKLDGSKVDVPLKASNLRIIELNLGDQKRSRALGNEIEKKDKKNPVSEKSKKTEKKDTPSSKSTDKVKK